MSLKKNVVANYVGQGSAGLDGILFVPLYIRYLGIEAYGLIGIFAMLQAWLSLLDVGMKPALGREMARFTSGASQRPVDSRSAAEHRTDRNRDCRGVVAVGIWAASGWLASHWLNVETLTGGSCGASVRGHGHSHRPALS